MRSEKTGLLGNTLNVDNLQWVRFDASIGAGADSFYEYMLKSYLLFGDEEYLEMFAGLYVAAMRHLRPKEPGWAAKGWLGEVHLHSGAVMRPWISSLSAFWPGLQATIGGSPCLLLVALSWNTLNRISASCAMLDCFNSIYLYWTSSTTLNLLCPHYISEYVSAHHCRPNGGCCNLARELDYGMEGIWMAA